MRNDAEHANYLGVEIGKDGILHLTIAGKFTKEHFFSMVSWTEKVKRILREETLKHPDRVILILCNLSRLDYFERSMVVPLRELLAYNKKFLLKSTVVGASPVVGAMIKALISLTGRSNVRIFDTEKEALSWLHEGVHSLSHHEGSPALPPS